MIDDNEVNWTYKNANIECHVHLVLQHMHITKLFSAHSLATLSYVKPGIYLFHRKAIHNTLLFPFFGGLCIPVEMADYKICIVSKCLQHVGR